jgi:hypothetical protein
LSAFREVLAMSDEKEKLLIKIGQSFEANATGRLAIVIVFAVIVLAIYPSLF